MQLVSGGPASEEYRRYATGFAVMGVLVLVLKLLGAVVALAWVGYAIGGIVGMLSGKGRENAH